MNKLCNCCHLFLPCMSGSLMDRLLKNVSKSKITKEINNSIKPCFLFFFLYITIRQQDDPSHSRSIFNKVVQNEVRSITWLVFFSGGLFSDARGAVYRSRVVNRYFKRQLLIISSYKEMTQLALLVLMIIYICTTFRGIQKFVGGI